MEVPKLKNKKLDVEKAARSANEVEEDVFSNARNIDLSGSDSDTSLETVASRDSGASRSSFWRKRRRSEEEDTEEDVSSAKVSAQRRGRGRPPTTGQYVGLAKAKALLNKARREELELEAEMEFAEEQQRKETANLFRKSPKEQPLEVKGMDAETLRKIVSDAVGTIQEVAKRSSNLKGTYVKNLNKAAQAISAAFEETRSRTVAEEVAVLSENNKQLTIELDVLRKEIKELRAAQQRPVPVPVPTPAPAEAPKVEDLCRTIMVQVGTMVSARLEALEERLLPEKRLRPPLAADKRKEKEASASCPMDIASPPETTPQAAAPSHHPKEKGSAGKERWKAPAPKPPKKKKGRGGKKTASDAVAPTQAEARSDPPASLPAPAEKEQWSKVVGRKEKRASGNQGVEPARARSAAPARAPLRKPGPQEKKKKTPKLRLPRTAAVVITLQPGAAERGVTYAKVLAEARSHIDLKALEMPPLKMKETATGARMFEVPGATKMEKADALATKLREVFQNTQDIQVSRPNVTADMRVSGLDDSVSIEELTLALAKVGGCPTADIRVGTIKRGPAGMGTAFVRCPRTAAKAIVAGSSRLLVGWVSAQVHLLEPRPRRCYRCLASGHVAAQCKAESDRSQECYRCGQKGHKAKECSAAPHCSLCAAAGKPANHLAGGKACAKPPTKPGKRRGTAATEAQAKPQASAPVITEESVVRMEES